MTSTRLAIIKMGVYSPKTVKNLASVNTPGMSYLMRTIAQMLWQNKCCIKVNWAEQCQIAIKLNNVIPITVKL